MKKKIINGILMVALLAATSTSFVSCKDNTEDVTTDLRGYIDTQKKNLQDQIDATNAALTALDARVTTNTNDIQTLKGDVTTLKGDVATLKNDLATVQNKVNDLDSQVTAIDNQLNAAGGIKDQIADIQSDINDINGEIDNIKSALRNLITSVTVNATSTNMLANSKVLPGINMQFLGAAYGKATTTGKFPSTTTLTGHGTPLKAADFAGITQIEWENGQNLPLKDEDTEKVPAGTVYFTVNPSNINDMSDVTLKLTDSQNAESFISLGEATPSSETLTWGITRSTAAEDGNTFDPILWEAPAYIDLKANDLAVIDPLQIIDFKYIASEVRTMIDGVEAAAEDANRSNYQAVAKSATKDLLKSTAQIVASVVNAKLPTLPALALSAQWTDMVGTRSVLSDYSIAATAYKPLSFDWGKELTNGKTYNFDKLDDAFARVINKLKSKVPGNFANVNITFDFSGVNKNVTLYTLVTVTATDQVTNLTISTSKAGANAIPTGKNISNVGSTTGAGTYYVPGLVNLSGTIDPIIAAVEAGVNVAQINSMINQVNKMMANVKSYADQSVSFEKKVSNFLERELNRVITKVNTDGITRILEPIILFQIGDNYEVNRFFEGTQLPVGKFDLIPTTMTNEILAPAYKKYVAVYDKDAKSFVKQVILTKGDKDFNKVSVDLKAGNYTVIYSALDFYGVQISKKYDIVVK